jgi:hypothetical protein
VNTLSNHLDADFARPDSRMGTILREGEETVSADIMGTTLGFTAEDADITGNAAATCTPDEAKEDKCVSATSKK